MDVHAFKESHCKPFRNHLAASEPLKLLLGFPHPISSFSLSEVVVGKSLLDIKFDINHLDACTDSEIYLQSRGKRVSKQFIY